MPLPEIFALFRQVEGRIKSFAMAQGQRTQTWLAGRGYLPGGQLDYRDLISASWRLLLEDSKRTFVSSDDLLQYFTGQIQGMINNIRRSARARYTHVSIAGGSAATESQLVIPEDDESLASADEYAEFEKDMVRQLFETSLATKAPRLLELMHLIVLGIRTASEQATRLQQSVSTVYKMRRELARLAEEFALKGENHE